MTHGVQMNKGKESKSTNFFGQYTEKERPFFDLAQALGVWGEPPQPVFEIPVFTTPAQGDLFGSLH